MKPLDELVGELLASEYVGPHHLFTEPTVVVPGVATYPIYVSHIYESDISFLSGIRPSDLGFVPHGGKGFTAVHALFSSLGEAVERTTPMISPPRADVFGSPEELGDNAVGPDKLHLFAPEQYGEIPFKPFTRRSRLGWVLVDRVGGGRLLMPAQILAFGYIRRRDEDVIGYASSDGLASGIGMDALYRAILEFVERDAINLGWHSDIPPIRIRMGLKEALDVIGITWSRPVDDYRLHVFLWRSDVEGVYVVSAHLIDPRRDVYSYMPGCGAGTSFEEALRRAMGEVGQAYVFASSIQTIRARFGKDSKLYYVPRDADPTRANNLFRIVWYWGYRENLQRLYDQFFSRASEGEVPRGGIDRMGHKLSILLDEAARRESVIYRYESRGFALVKFFSLGLTQYNSPRWPYLGHPRYYDARKILGICDCRLTYADLRKIPVPYP